MRLNAVSLMAETEINVPAYDFLRGNGFSPIGHQKVWRIPENIEPVEKINWRVAKDEDRTTFMRLYKELTPPMVRNAERPMKEMMLGMVYEEFGEKVGLLRFRWDCGVVVRLLIHPKIQEPEECLLELAKVAQPMYTRPLYFIVPSYMGWLEYTLARMNAEMSDLMAVLVRHTTVRSQTILANQKVNTRKVAISGMNRFDGLS